MTEQESQYKKYRHLFLDEKLSIKLQSIGFDEVMFARWYKHKWQLNTLGTPYKHNSGEVSKNYIGSPTYDQVRVWFEQKHHLFICVESGGAKHGVYKHDFVVWGNGSTSVRGFLSTHEAWNAAIEAAIKLITDKETQTK